MSRARRNLQAALTRAAALSVILGSGVGLVNVALLWGIFPGLAMVVILLTYLALGVWSLVVAATTTALLPMRLISIISVGCYVAFPMLGPTHPTSEYSPLTHVLVIGGVCASISFGAFAGATTAVLAGVATALIRAEQTSVLQGVLEGALLAVTGFAAALAVVLIRRASASVALATDELWQLQALAAQSRQADIERGRFDSIVHDAVIGGLLIAGRGLDDDAARHLAAEAVAAYDSGGVDSVGGGDDWPSRVRDVARRLGLDLVLQVRGMPRQTWVSDAIFTATAEALSNVARHSGQTQAHIQAIFSPRLMKVVIRDEGRGFDLAQRSPRRAGISTSIQGRLRAVGGDAEIESAPGRGTTVSLTARPVARAGEVPTTPWRVSAFAPLLVMAVVAIGIHAAIGFQYLDAVRLPALDYAGVAVILGLLLWTWRGPQRRSTWVSSSLLLVALVVCLSANVREPAIHDWRLWFVGALDGVIALIAFRHSAFGGIVTAIVIPAAMTLTFLVVAGNAAGSAVLSAATQLVVCAILGLLLRRGLDLAATSMNQVARMAYRLRVDELAREARVEEVRLRNRELGSACLPMLRRISEGGMLSEEDRRQCLRLEAAVRDQLVARRLLDQDLVAALDQARSRGIRVDLAVGKGAADSTLITLRDLLGLLLPNLRTPSTVRATAAPVSHLEDLSSAVKVPGRIVVTCQGSTEGAFDAAVVALGQDSRVGLEVIDEVLLVQVLPVAPSHLIDASADRQDSPEPPETAEPSPLARVSVACPA
jgi:hypothetical protein